MEHGIRGRDLERNVNEFWIPRSVIIETDLEDEGDVGDVAVKTWWAQKEDWPGADDSEDDEREDEGF